MIRVYCGLRWKPLRRKMHMVHQSFKLVRWTQIESNFSVCKVKFLLRQKNKLFIEICFHPSFICFILENALKSLTVDVIEQLQNAAAVVGSESSSEEDKVNALDTILNYVDDIDTANDFCKIGGLFVLLPCLESTIPTIREKTILLMAEMAQNNPFCQKELLDGGVLPKLMNLLGDKSMEIAAIRSISCLVRGYEPSSKEFLKIGGIECLLKCLQSENEQVVSRSSFLLRSICIDFPYIRIRLCEMGALKIIIPLIQPRCEYNASLETLLSLLCLFGDFGFDPNYDSLVNILEEIVLKSGNKPECKETVDYCQQLLERLNKNELVAENSER